VIDAFERAPQVDRLDPADLPASLQRVVSRSASSRPGNFRYPPICPGSGASGAVVRLGLAVNHGDIFAQWCKAANTTSAAGIPFHIIPLCGSWRMNALVRASAPLVGHSIPSSPARRNLAVISHTGTVAPSTEDHGLRKTVCTAVRGGFKRIS